MAARKEIKFFRGEKWKPIPRKKTPYGERYTISSYGRLVKYKHWINSGSQLKLSRQQGYPIWRYKDEREYQHALLHKLVAKHFLPKPGKLQQFVIHLDYDKENNHYRNLKWVTQEQLTKHSFKNPAVIKAKKQMLKNIGNGYNTKLTETKVKQIKFLLQKGKTLKELAVRFKVSDMQIHRIKTGENWGHLK